MPVVPIFGNASVASSTTAWYGLDGLAQATCVAGPAHTGFYGSAQIAAQTNAPKVDIVFQTYPAAASAKTFTPACAIEVYVGLTPAPANCALGIKRGANCDGPYGCLEVEAGNPVLSIPNFLLAQASPTCSAVASLGVDVPMYSDRPPSCLAKVDANASLGIIRGLTGAAQASLSTFDVPTRSGDISGLVVLEVRLEAVPAYSKCSTYVCVSDFVVTGPPTGDWLVLVDDPFAENYTGIGPPANIFNTQI